MKCKIKSFFTAFFICVVMPVNAYAGYVIPLGMPVGVCIHTDGLIITSVSEVTDENGHSVNAAGKADLKKGDRITAVDGNPAGTTEELGKYILNRKNQIIFTIERNGRRENKIVTPVKTNEGYRIGIWVRDSTAGIGTLTFYDPESNIFAGLGHGISDVDTGEIIPVKSGKISGCEMTEPLKGKKGTPGELNGKFTGEKLGIIRKNSPCGIFGTATENPFPGTGIETAANHEISTGEAFILSDPYGTGTEKYSVIIEKISPDDSNNKNMIVKVTDEKLIRKTGGIVQGMSGSPIIQNGKIVGAVTHVFVNDPTRGYGIFIGNMLTEAEKIK